MITYSLHPDSMPSQRRLHMEPNAGIIRVYTEVIHAYTYIIHANAHIRMYVPYFTPKPMRLDRLAPRSRACAKRREPSCEIFPLHALSQGTEECTVIAISGLSNIKFVRM